VRYRFDSRETRLQSADTEEQQSRNGDRD